MLTYCVCLFFVMVLSGCAALDNTDTVGTLQAQSVVYETEVGAIATDSNLLRERVAATAGAAATTVAEENGRNQVLLQTLSAGSTPTMAIVSDPSGIGASRNSGVVNPPIDLQEGETRFIATGTSSVVSDVDGCIIGASSRFETNVSRVYGTLQAFNVTQGTFMETDWYRGQELVWEDSWTVDSDYDQICIWFFIQPSYVAFTEGNWSVQFFANGQPIDQPIPFNFEMVMNDG